jgi:signal peptidase II
MQATRGASLTRDHAPHPRASRLGLLLSIAVVAWLADLGSKVLAQRELSGHAPVEVLGSLLRLNLTHNSGAAFSTGRSLTPLISVFAIGALVVVVVLARRVRTAGWAWALGLLLAGIAGNLTDRLFRDPVEVIGSLLRLHLTRNAGAAFSTGTSLTPVIALFAVVAFVVVAVLAARVGTTGWAWAMGLLLAGIGGNLTDRIFREPGPLRGHVIDFLELPHWPIFNVADICINVAAALIVLQSVRGVPLRGVGAEQ